MRHALAAVGAAACLYAGTASAADCSLLAPWRATVAAQAAGATSIAERSRLEQAEWLARQGAAQAAFGQYRAGMLDAGGLLQCLEGDIAKQNFLDSLYGAFYSGSLDALRGSHSPAIRNFLAEFDRKNGNTVPIFRVMGFQEQTPAPLPGGYQRAVHSIYLHFGEVKPNDWLILFSHEVLHSLDEQLWVGVNTYSQPEEAAKFAAWSEQFSTVSALPPPEQIELQAWIRAGLDRGLLAEYRAWSATFEIYFEGMSEGLWKPIDWIDAIVQQRKPKESLEAFTFRFLDARSPDPTDGLFAHKLLQSALAKTRQEIRSGPSPSLANLDRIVHVK